MNYKISASILNADFLHLKEDIDSIINHVDEIHLDIMDGNFVDNISFGIPVLKNIFKHYSKMIFDTHLMINSPHKYLKDFISIGSNIITFHHEATTHSYILIKKIKDSGVSAGISVNPGTNIGLLEPLKDIVDRILVMTVEPGFGGQEMIVSMLKKVEKARKLFGDNVDIEVDGGIDAGNILSAKNAGANVFVVGSHIFGSQDRKETIRILKSNLKKDSRGL